MLFAAHRCVAWNQGGRRLADLVVEHLRRGAVASDSPS